MISIKLAMNVLSKLILSAKCFLFDKMTAALTGKTKGCSSVFTCRACVTFSRLHGGVPVRYYDV